MADDELEDIGSLGDDTLRDDDVDLENSDDEDESTDGNTDESTDDEDNSDDDSEKDSEEDGDEEEPKEDEDEDKEPDEKVEPGSLYAKLNKSNPEIFKKHPELRDVIVREDKYSEIFPSPEVAEEVKGRYKDYVAFEEGIISGNPEGLLKSLEANNKEALLKFAHNFFPTLKRISGDMHNEVMTRPMKQVLLNAYLHGKKNGNKNLELAALHINQLYFDDEPIDQIPELPKDESENPERKALLKEKQDFETRRYEMYHTDVSEVYTNFLERDITKSVADLEIPEYTRKQLIKDIVKKTDELASQDKKHLTRMNSLWADARLKNFPHEYKSKLYKQALAKAKSVIPIAKKLVLKEAKLIKGSKTSEKSESRKPTRITGGSSTGNSTKEIDWTKTSMEDYLADRNIHYKK
jgi:hypothetical protein